MRGNLLFFQYLADELASVYVGEAYEVDSLWQIGDVDVQRFAFARCGGHALSHIVEDFGLFKVFTCDGDEAVGGVGVNMGILLVCLVLGNADMVVSKHAVGAGNLLVAFGIHYIAFGSCGES